jgi:hypothetical protein
VVTDPHRRRPASCDQIIHVEMRHVDVVLSGEDHRTHRIVAAEPVSEVVEFDAGLFIEEVPRGIVEPDGQYAAVLLGDQTRRC